MHIGSQGHICYPPASSGIERFRPTYCAVFYSCRRHIPSATHFTYPDAMDRGGLSQPTISGVEPGGRVAIPRDAIQRARRLGDELVSFQGFSRLELKVERLLRIASRGNGTNRTRIPSHERR
jgi:hypothetical protein